MIISIANQKGGVGKTTLAITFSNFLIENEKELLVVDFDFQSSFFSLWNEEKELYENEANYEVIQKDLSEAKSVVKSLENVVDSIVLLDLPGKLDDDNLIPLFNITDLLIIPFSYDKISVESTLFFIQLVRHIKPDIELIFIPNRVKTNVKYKTKSQVDITLKKYGTVTDVIPDRVSFQRLSTLSNSSSIKEITENQFTNILKKINP